MLLKKFKISFKMMSNIDYQNDLDLIEQLL